MRGHVSVAFWTFVTPLAAARSLRVGLLLAGIFVLVVLGIFLGNWASERLLVEALEGTRHFLVMLALPVGAAILSEMALRDGIRHRTLLYPLLGPVPRRTLALVRTLVTGLLLGTGASLLLLFVRALLQDGFSLAGREVLALFLGALAYTAMFGVLHLISRRGLITGLVLLFFLDFPLGRVPFALRNLSPSYHVGVIANQQRELELPVALALPETSVLLSALLLAGLAVAFLAAGAELFRRKSLGELC